jgi:hypothetical protein
MNSMKRTIGRVAAVGAVALLLTGAVAATAEARTYEAQFYSQCLSVGGQPFTIYGDGLFGYAEVVCDLGHGSFDSTYTRDLEP